MLACNGRVACIMSTGHDSDTGREDSVGKQKLVFRGLILRHQLVMLLKNRIFFNEGDGVSGASWGVGVGVGRVGGRPSRRWDNSC